MTYGPDGEAYVAAAAARRRVDRAGGFPGSDAARFVRPDLAMARLEAPLQRAGETIGLLMVGSRADRGFEVDEVETLSSLANQAAIAIENARLQARLRELAVVAERERIAREMHDGLAQVLGYVNTKSQAIEELLAAGRTAEARGLLAELAAAARSIYVDVREAILGLRSPVVPGRRVSSPRSRSTRRASPRRPRSPSGSRRPTTPARLDLAPDVEAQVFHIVQEALTNVRKHSGAARAEIGFAVIDGRLDVVVADDGQGIEPRRRRRTIGPRYGLRAMRERADSIGATVDWTSPPSGGCRVHADVAAAGGAPAVPGIA